MPLFLKIIYKHNLELCKKNNLNLILIDDNNVNNYITPHPRFENLAYNFKSDIIRYYILHKYGGFWFDTDVIIIKNLHDLYKSISEYECMLDIEYNTKIGCASLFIKKQSTVSKFCLDYVNNFLNKNQTLSWVDIGPRTVETLYKNHKSLVLLNNYQSVKNGCNFICWNSDPGINKKDWYFESDKLAKSKADFLSNNNECYYLITWTIYRKNDMGNNLNNMVFSDKRSVFSYFINYEKKQIIVKNSPDDEWNGQYLQGEVKWKDNGTISYVKDNKHHIYQYQGLWRLGENGVKCYKQLGNNIGNEIDLNDYCNKIIINKPVINYNVITCKINFIDKEIIIRNEYNGIDNLYDGIEGFVSLFIPHMLLTNDKIIVKDKICKKFYDNLLKLKKYYESLNIGTINFNLDCEITEKKSLSEKRRKISTFTGGVDSFYTLLTNLDKIDTLLYCINYDVRESQQNLLKAQLNTVKEVAQKLGKKVIVCNTNQRNILEWGNIGYLNGIKKKYNNDLWGYFLHGPCIFSNAYNLLLEYDTIFIPSTHPKSSNYLWGSSFHIDHLYSSSLIKIIHNGDCTRVAKIKNIIKLDKNLIFNYLKVCYCNSNQKYNCSVCEKCKRTYIPIGIINKDYLKQLKTFNIVVEDFEKTKNKYLCMKFNKNSDIDFQNEIKDLDRPNTYEPKMKKYAVMWASTVNIGDDIQTLAAINFLKKKGITEYSFIDREKLCDYNGEPVTLIMNGWFMHNIKKFPPSNKITPLFISVHINKESLIRNNINYFKKYGPIGCRDDNTVKLFKKYGIDAYFTGCLTLLFDDVTEKTGGKYLVDVNTKCSYIPNTELDTSKYNDFQIIEHDINKNMLLKDRLIMAENLLNKYRTAKQVITTRLHCILPCRAFNTDSIFIHKNYEYDPRFQGLKGIINGDTQNHCKTNGDRYEIEKIRNNFLLLKI